MSEKTTTNEGDTAEAAPSKSIIPGKYAAAYKERGADWLGEMIAHECNVTVEGTDKKKASTGLELNKLFDLGKANSVDTSKYHDQVDRPNAIGRLRMTIGNMLRARAKRRHGMFNIAGKWHNAPADWLKLVGADENPSEKRDGTKIALPKVEKSDDDKKPVAAAA